jgi:aldose 1-epimerase
MLAAGNGSHAQTARVAHSLLGQADGRDIDVFVLTNHNGLTLRVMSRGAAVTELDTPDRNGKLDDIVLGFDTLQGYLNPANPYFGAMVGRVANRIARGRFTLDGRRYQLATNDGPNHLHGGVKGFDKVLWTGEVIPGATAAVRFSYLSADGEEGYPGNCRAEVTYELTDANELRIGYVVTTDRDTPVNLTSHTYFNLAGAEHGDVLGHELTLNADRYTPVDETLIPTGVIAPVAGTPMDFLHATPIGAHLKAVGGNPVGYDHNYVVTGGGGGLTLVAQVHEPTSGRTMEVWSTEPGVQFYTGNFLDGTLRGKKGVMYRQYAGFTLETQHFPDSINHDNFPSYVLKAGATHRSTTVFRFSAD